MPRAVFLSGYSLLILSFAFLFSVSITHAQTTCLKYLTGSTPPSGFDSLGRPWGYGASWDVFSSGRELLVKSNCPTSGTSITLTVGKGDTSQYIWGKTYTYNNSVSPPRWDEYILSGTTDAQGWITSGAGTKTITTPFTATASNPLLFVGYVCTLSGTTYKCGCANASCSTHNWQLQGYIGTGDGGGTAACKLKNDLFLNPFNKNSAHHKPIGTGAVYGDRNSDARNVDFHHWDRFGINDGSPWGLHVVKLDGSSVNITVNKGYPEASQLPATIPMPIGGVNLDRIERDNQIAIFDMRSGGSIHHVRGYQWNAGNPIGRQYRNYQFNSLGHGTRTVKGTGTTASDVSAPFGILRGYEANTPGVPIQHAIQFVAPRQGGACHNLLGLDSILPATGRDGTIGPGDNTGSAPYGSLFAIPPESKGGPRLEDLGLSEAGLRLAKAIRDYGMYLVDGGGCGPAIRADQDVNKNLFMDEIPKFYGHIRVVTNSEWNPNDVATGGGTPIAPNCAFDAP